MATTYNSRLLAPTWDWMKWSELITTSKTSFVFLFVLDDPLQMEHFCLCSLWYKKVPQWVSSRSRQPFFGLFCFDFSFFSPPSSFRNISLKKITISEFIRFSFLNFWPLLRNQSKVKRLAHTYRTLSRRWGDMSIKNKVNPLNLHFLRWW